VHTLVTVLQMGSVEGHSPSAVHSTHVPLVSSQMGRALFLAAHSESSVQAAQVKDVTVSQMGVVATVHSEEAVHAWQAPLVSSQYGSKLFLVLHWESAVQAVQVPLALQMGVAPEQSVSAWHWTHTLGVAAVSQKGAVEGQSGLARHWSAVHTLPKQ
jgi:hypothetical protein